MFSFNKLYFINTGSSTGAINMALDNEIFDKFFNNEILFPVLRFYSWSEPTLSIGYNQEFPLQNHQIPVVKRITGGQAVFHDINENELTYSFVLKSTLKPRIIYSELAKIFISFLRKYDLNSSVGYLGAGNNVYRDSFNCFESRTEADIVVNDVKVIGSAQRVRRIIGKDDKNQYILQHGSIKLDKIRQLTNTKISYDIASIDLSSTFGEKLGVDIIKLKDINEVFHARSNNK